MVTPRDPTAAIRADHPLRRLFNRLCEQCLIGRLGFTEPEVARYLSGLLTRFTHMDNLCQIRDSAGRPLDDVGEMLLESDPRTRASSFDREREVRRHIGDYTLFFLGLFPEYLHAHASTRVPDLFVDWVRAGRESYHIVSAFNLGPYAEEAPLFARLSEQYELCVVGLNLVKQELALLPDPGVRDLRAAFSED